MLLLLSQGFWAWDLLYCSIPKVSACDFTFIAFSRNVFALYLGNNNVVKVPTKERAREGGLLWLFSTGFPYWFRYFPISSFFGVATEFSSWPPLFTAPTSPAVLSVFCLFGVVYKSKSHRCHQMR